MEEKRRYKRSDLEERVRLRYVGKDDGSHEKEIDVSMTDVSEDGAGFFYEEELNLEDCYEGDVRLWTKQTIHAFLKIIRKKEIEGGFVYGCIFFGMESRETMRIKIYQMLEEQTDEQ